MLFLLQKLCFFIIVKISEAIDLYGIFLFIDFHSVIFLIFLFSHLIFLPVETCHLFPLWLPYFYLCIFFNTLNCFSLWMLPSGKLFFHNLFNINVDCWALEKTKPCKSIVKRGYLQTVNCSFNEVLRGRRHASRHCVSGFLDHSPLLFYSRSSPILNTRMGQQRSL